VVITPRYKIEEHATVDYARSPVRPPKVSGASARNAHPMASAASAVFTSSRSKRSGSNFVPHSSRACW
jgi:hypothetical protein